MILICCIFTINILIERVFVINLTPFFVEAGNIWGFVLVYLLKVPQKTFSNMQTSKFSLYCTNKISFETEKIQLG